MAQGHTGNQVYILVENHVLFDDASLSDVYPGPDDRAVTDYSERAECAEDRREQSVKRSPTDGYQPAGEAPDVTAT